MWEQLIKDLGGATAVSAHLGLKPNAVSNWTKRGVPWRHRPRLADYAKKKRVELPDNFLHPVA